MAAPSSRTVGDDSVQIPGRDDQIPALLGLHQGGDARRKDRHTQPGASRCREWSGWAGWSPVSENWSVRPSRSGSAEQRLSTQSRAAGRSSRTSAPASCCKLRPVAADTPGATAATGRMPCTGTVRGPMVTNDRSAPCGGQSTPP